MSHAFLLDTPKRASLQSRADTLRVSLKDFERSFAAEHGKKPGKDAIKANEDVSRKYKEYNKLRDVLAGKAGLDALEDRSPKRKRQDKAVVDERKRKEVEGTPRGKRVEREYVYDEEEDYGFEEGVQLPAIGPTPQRDGMVMGLFDMMSNPGSGSHLRSGAMNTPGGKKRKVDVLGVLGEDEEALVAATPDQNQKRQAGDLLQFLGDATPATGRAKHSRTPISEGRKFMLNQFFATPSAVRYSQIVHGGTPKKDDADVMERTPLKNHVLGMTPSTKRIMSEEKDKTPNYLKRSHSFKDRLLSASTVSAPTSKRNSLDTPLSPVSLRSGPSLMKPKTRFQPKSLSQIAAEMRQRDQDQRDAEDDDEDGMEALRELEDAELNVETGSPEAEVAQPMRAYKKKGQKRTTRRVIMRPQPKLQKSTAAKQDGPVLSDDEDEIVEETQVQPANTNADEDEWSDDELFQALAADDEKNENSDHENDDEFDDGGKLAKKRNATKKDSGNKVKTFGKASKPAKAPKEDDTKDQRTYNPNAAAHQNFKTLKIKNKNSKGKFKGGRGGRFGGRRR